MDAIIEALIKAGLWPDQTRAIRPLIEAYAVAAIRVAVNDKLEEVAAELDKLSQGHYTTAQTPAGLVRKMREHQP